MGWGTGTNGEQQRDTKLLPQIPGSPVQPLCRRREDEGGCACSVLPKPVPDIFSLAREHLGVYGKAVSCFLLTRHLSSCAQKVLPWAKSPKPHKSCDSNNLGSDPHSMDLAEAEDENYGSTHSWPSLGNLECRDKSSRRMPGDGVSRMEMQSQGRSCREEVDDCLHSLLDARNKHL